MDNGGGDNSIDGSEKGVNYGKCSKENCSGPRHFRDILAGYGNVLVNYYHSETLHRRFHRPGEGCGRKIGEVTVLNF